MTLSQSCADTLNQPASEKQPFHIPVSCALFDKKRVKKVDEQLFELREASQVFQLLFHSIRMARRLRRISTQEVLVHL